MFLDRVSKVNIVEAIYICLLPIVISFVYEYQFYGNADGYLDPWLYFGYINNFQDLVARYGLPYYAVRFGMIFPHIVFSKILGPIPGFLAFVYSMYLLAGVPLYLLFRKYFSLHSAVLAYTILVSSIWFATTVHWTYPDATGVPYLIAATALILLDARHSRATHFFIGVLFALAANSNIFALAIAGLSGIAYLILYFDSILVRLKRDIPWMIAGFCLVMILGSIGYYLCCNTFNYFSNTLYMIKLSNNEGGVDYKAPLVNLLKLNYIYLPPFVALLLLIQSYTFNVSHPRIVYAALSYLIATGLFFIGYQIATNAAIIETHYYFSYFLVPAIFCIAFIPVLLVDKNKFITYFAVVNFLVIPLIQFENTTTTYILWSASMLAFLSLLFVSYSKIIIPFVIMAYGLVVHVVWTAPLYLDIIIQGRNYGNNDVRFSRYRLGLKFIESMPKYFEERKPIYFWYRNEDSLAQSLQSTYLWGYSRIMDSAPDTPGLPSLKGLNLDILKSRTSLILFDRDNQFVEKGIDALRQQGLKFNIKSTEQICESDTCYSIAVLDSNGFESATEKKWKDGSLVPVNFNLSWNNAGTGEIIEQEGVSMSVNTLPLPWNYGAAGVIVYSGNYSGQPAVIRVVVSVSSTNIGFGFTGENISDFITRIEILPEKGPQEFYFEFDNIEEVKNIIVSGWDKAETARVEVLEFEIRAAGITN